MKTEFETQLLASNSQIDTLTNEINIGEQRISHLEADILEFEKQNRDKDGEISKVEADVDKYIQINTNLSKQVDDLQKQCEEKKKVDTNMENLHVLEKEIAQMTQLCKKFKEGEAANLK